MSKLVLQLLLVILSLPLVLFSACDSTFIDPFENEDRFYTIYGFLDQTTNFQPGARHAVRVIPVTRSAERIEDPSDGQASIDARVFSIDTMTGQEIEWTHSLDRFENGNYGHVFRSNFSVVSGRTYRLEVRRSDGIITSAETTVPSLSSVVAQRPLPVRSEPDQQVLQDILLPGIASIWDITVIYRLRSPDCFTANTSVHRLPYGKSGALTDGGWRLTTRVSDDKETIAEQRTDPILFLCSMGVEVKVLDSNWPLPSTGEALAPLSFENLPSNVQNGYGFWGSIGLLQSDWQISDSLAVYMGQTLPIR